MRNKKYKFKKIIFIIADTLRTKNIGAYGRQPSPTPSIDKLAQSGVIFTNAYCSITKTDPSITSIMSGKYPASIGLVNHAENINPLEEINVDKTQLLSEILKHNGFKTAAVDWLGRWHKRGYDYYSGRIIQDNVDINPVTGKFPFPLFLRILDKIAIKYLRREFFIRFYYAFFSNPKIPYDPADVVINRAIKILSSNKQNKLFLYIHLWDAHFPHTKLRGLKSYIRDDVDDTYNAEINFLDGEIGRLITFLKQTKQLDDTLLVFTSDHGENFYEHDVPFNHENLYEDIVRVPLIFKYGKLSPKKIRTLVQHVDILPTILDFLNIPLTYDIDGNNLLPLILGKTQEARKSAYLEDLVVRAININDVIIRRRGLRVGDHKYIQALKGKRKELSNVTPPTKTKILYEELYNLKTDPQEKNNLIHKKRKIAKRLSAHLRRLIDELNRKRLRTKSVLDKNTGKQLKKDEGKEQLMANLKSLGY